MGFFFFLPFFFSALFIVLFYRFVFHLVFVLFVFFLFVQRGNKYGLRWWLYCILALIQAYSLSYLGIFVYCLDHCDVLAD